MKILVLGDHQYGEPWRVTYPKAEIAYVNTHLTTRYIDVGEYDAIQFTGGYDVSPALYGEDNHAASCHEQRDMWEVQLFLSAKRLLIPCFGICRGSQFLRVMCGGRLIQDFHGHAIGGTHMAEFTGHEGPKTFDVTSTHHQYSVRDPKRFFDFLMAGDVVEGWHNIHSHHTCVAVQYHPEYMKHESSGFRFYQDVLHYVMDGDYKTWCLD